MGALCTELCSLSNPGSLTGLVLSVQAHALCRTWDLSQDGYPLYGPMLSVKPGISYRTGVSVQDLCSLSNPESLTGWVLLCMGPCFLLNPGSVTGWVLSVQTHDLCQTRDLSQDRFSLYGPMLSVKPRISHRTGALCRIRDLLQDRCSLYGPVLSLKPRISHRTGALCMGPCFLLNPGSLTGQVLSVCACALC